MTTTGPANFATFSSDNAVGTVAWTNASNAQTSNNSRAQAAALSGLEQVSQYLKCLNASTDLSDIPDDDVVTAIQIRIERHRTGGGTTTVSDNAVRLVVGGVVQSDNQAQEGTWPNGTDGAVTYDFEGLALTGAQVKASDFGVVLAAGLKTTVFDGVQANVDQISIVSVTHEEPPAAGGKASQTLSIGLGLSL